LQDKVAVVTGGGRGIGRDIVLAYAREGAQVVVNDINPATAEQTAQDAAALGSNSLAVVADVAKPADIARLIATTVKERGRIDILVNNAMKIVPGRLESLSEEAWDTTMNIGLKGAFLTSQAAAKHMMAQKSGAIVNIASIAAIGWLGVPYASYAASKAAIIGFTRHVALEHAARGIRCNAILPGLMDTPMIREPLARAYGGSIEAMLAKRAAQCPMGFMGDAWDVAHAALFLASDEARYITGVALPVDAGNTNKP
jgi:NAD(P)-dependent dehydrogenase (short-subunit alcohol dehydrogenase family)